MTATGKRASLFQRLDRKIQVLFAVVFIVSVTGLQIGMYVMVYNGVEAQYLRELDQTTAMIAGNVRTYVDASFRTFLVCKAQKVRGMFGYFYSQ